MEQYSVSEDKMQGYGADSDGAGQRTTDEGIGITGAGRGMGGLGGQGEVGFNLKYI